MNQLNRIIEIATEEIGYLEKKTNADLDHKTKNAGHNNFTKYWRDLAPSLQGQPWCAAFTSWCARQAGIPTSIIPTIFSCTQIRNWARERGLFHAWASATPQRGDHVIFHDSNGTPNHIGLVVDVTNVQISTIEGNTSSGNNTVEANGGGVFRKTYQRSNTRIAGYFRPKYEVSNGAATQPAENNTTPVLRQGENQHTDAIRELQTLLNRHGCIPALSVDGRHGPLTNAAVRNFQAAKNLTVDGVVGPRTWEALRNVPASTPVTTVPQPNLTQTIRAVNYKVRINTVKDPLSVRSEPSTARGAETVIRSVPKDTIQTVVAETEGPGAFKWYELIDGGWISADLVVIMK
jgi:hypothetical protein